MNNKKKKTILHIANLTNDKSKGPNTNVPQNIIYGNKYANVGLYNLHNSEIPIKLPKNKYFSINKYKNIKELPAEFNNPDIIIFQGLYFIKYCCIAKKLRRSNIPYIIVPRCSMTTAAIKSHYLKKLIANKLFFKKFVNKAQNIQFLTQNEYYESKNNFSFNNYFIVGNGTETPKLKYKLKNREEFIITYIGRYNIYHKGLDILIDAVRLDPEWFRNNKVQILLYGSDSDNGLNYLINTIDNNNIDDIIRIMGPIYDREKEKALLNSDMFIHTSRLEGQPTSIIEAISYGIPVIVTPGTNFFNEVNDFGLGYTSSLASPDVLNCIKNAYKQKDRFKEISDRAIEYSKSNFNWDTITKKAIEISTKDL